MFIEKKRKPRKPCYLMALLLMVSGEAAAAPSSTTDLMGLGIPAAPADAITRGPNSSSDYVIGVDGDPQRRFTFDASSDTSLTFQFGDGGTTAAQVLGIAASTSDADDDSTTSLSGGGAATNTRGGTIVVYGNEVTSNGGKVVLQAGDDADADMEFYTENSASNFTFQDVTSGELWRIANTGAVTHGKATDYNFSVGLATIAFQEAVAGTACSGTLTLNGATPVVTSTTCATTGSRIFLTRTSIDADTTGDMAVTAISNGVSFSVTSEVSDTATVNWVIFHEAP